MALISKKIADKKEKIKIDLTQSLIKDINHYMQWANIDDMGYFLEECVTFVLKQDKEWTKYKKLAGKNEVFAAKNSENIE